MTELTKDEINKLQKFAATTILSKLRDNVPSQMKYDNQELLSEIWNQYIYLISNYKDGDLSITSYCFKYVYERTLNAIWKEYKTKKSFVNLETLTKEQSTMNTPETEINIKEDKIEIDNRIASILSQMSPQDILIAQDYMYGMTLEQIGLKHKISKQAVLKRLKKYSK